MRSLPADDAAGKHDGSGGSDGNLSLDFHLCRLRFFKVDEWSLAFFTYSHERYEPHYFDNGTFFGTPEEGLAVGAVYLEDR